MVVARLQHVRKEVRVGVEAGVEEKRGTAGGRKVHARAAFEHCVGVVVIEEAGAA
jgi:hypothetical protein